MITDLRRRRRHDHSPVPARPWVRAVAAAALPALACAGLVPMLPAGAPAQAAEAAPAQCTVEVTGGELLWGVKQSYRSYIQGPMNDGWTLSGYDFRGSPTGADGAFVMPVTAGASSLSANGVEVHTVGSVQFMGHKGLLDTTLSNIGFAADAQGSAVLTGDYSSKNLSGDVLNGQGAVLATVGSPALPVIDQSGTFSYDTELLPTTLAQAGADSLDGGMGAYNAGQEVDPVSLHLTYTVSCDDPTPADPAPAETAPAETAAPVESEAPAEPSAAPSVEPSEEPGGGDTQAPGGEPSVEPSAPAAEPSAPATDAATAAPSAPTSDAPSAAPVAPPASEGELQCGAVIVGGELSWGVKQSYRRYIQSPMNDGWTLGAPASFRGSLTGADGAFVFPVQESRSAVGADGSFFARTSGSVRFTGHAGILDTSISDLGIVRMNDGSAVLVGDYSAKSESLDGTVNTGDDVVIASLDSLPAITVPAQGASAEQSMNTSVTLTDSGVKVFGENSYVPGTVVDNATLTLHVESRCGEAFTPGTAVTAPTGTTTTDTSSTPQLRPAPQGSAAGAGSSAPQSTPAKEEITCKTTGHGVSAGSLNWGLRSSFRSYITGSIANGAIEASGGASNNGGTFGFSARSGKADPASTTATIAFGGQVHFTGHHGILDMTISNPVIHVTSPTSGYLEMTVASTDMSGNPVNPGTVRFADLSFSTASITEKSISLETSAVTLTAAGAAAFAGFYSAGESLDNLTASATLSDSVTCYDSQGNVVQGKGSLAATGADGIVPLVALSLTALVIGSGLVIRRRVH